LTDEQHILRELKTVLPNACLRQGFYVHQGSGGQVGIQTDFIIVGFSALDFH
jgi:hypothetical protein